MERRRFLAGVATSALFGSACARRDRNSAEGGGSSLPPPEKNNEKQIDYAIELEDNGQPHRVREDRTFHSGERFRFLIRPAFECHLYLINRGPRTSQYDVLFPSPRIEIRNPIASGTTVTIPGKDDERWLHIDDRPGNESLVLIAATAPLEDFALASGKIPRDDVDDSLAAVERKYRPASSRRFEDGGWVKLFAASSSEPLAIVLRIPLLHF
jgi:hypothetical protein